MASSVYILLDVIYNIFTFRSNSILSAFVVVAVNILYKLFTYLQ